jgi:hypothetical protein
LILRWSFVGVPPPQNDSVLSLSSLTVSVIGCCCHPGLGPGSLTPHLRDPPDKPGDDKQKSSLILRWSFVGVPPPQDDKKLRSIQISYTLFNFIPQFKKRR